MAVKAMRAFGSMKGFVGSFLGLACLAGSAAPANASIAPSQLSVMTYNVEGLPFPVRIGRADKLRQIGATLATLRAEGRQPHVVVLQEAFSADAKAITAQAGYRYAVNGPASTLQGAQATSTADRRFADAASLFRGERSGKWADSGLRIASDYPILAVRRMAYPAYACAGFDCLANKGVLAVTIRVPGLPEPVAVVATHLNSRMSSHAPAARSLYAYQRQVDALGDFVRKVVPDNIPFVLAGDLNVGRQIDRRSYLIRNTALWRQSAPLDVAMARCLPDPACNKSNLVDLRYSFRRARDWQFYSPGQRAALQVTAVSGLFGHDAKGAMLSDHVGYVASYLVTSRQTAPLVVASR
ncbi:sphingomyelin phosphodiesterase [Sphingomonas sp. AP4-R1]|uniref:sphingomyelin phosphodiesterase n=1 Tax=Sphingomonas sp. AP4-R1 TaxID=2735134 RepID=UPI001493D4A9|nr:sphingomyelin phosphodiesterase [Sphingomonas sp. AP4-R1]QJU60343.1 sphingomyelin phosphodiesterase [Sphingomonas sp. AP4-R1]